uniref:Uncharacterized protein n=1 Tax=Panagrolaimus sp. ES5 TaxID=591445 RepID=A0AC34FT91_9BILA
MSDPDKKFHLKKEDPELNVNSSTLSLHIAAYENYVETTSINFCDTENTKDVKTVINIVATPANQIPFEFPRQQENHVIEPEVAQFKASQKLLNPNETPVKKGGRPKGSMSKKTLSAETRRENIHQRYTASILDTMNEQQLFHYNLEVKKTEKAEREANEERLRAQELQNQVLALQSVIKQNADELEIERESRKNAETNYEAEKVKRKLVEQRLDDFTKENSKNMKNAASLQKANEEQKIALKVEMDKNKEICRILKEKENEAAIIFKCNEKLQANLNEMANTNRSLKIKNEGSEVFTKKLQSDNEKLNNDLTILKETSNNAIRKLPTKIKNQSTNEHRYAPYEISSSRTQRRRVQKTVQELKAIPDMAVKVLDRLKPNNEKKKKHKITPLQAVTMLAIVGFNVNQMENMKSFLRFFGMDVLPPVHLMRKFLKAVKQEFEYDEFEDKEMGVVGRRIPDIEKVMSIRGARVMESSKWIDIPGFENFAFFGLNSDSGGGFLHCSVSIMNVKDGWGSPNDGTIVATGKIPKENYEIVKCVCGYSFNQLNQLNGKEISFEVNGATVTKTVLVIVCFDGKMGSICSGHSGASSAMPCYCCPTTKKNINDGIIGELRSAATMLQQAEHFQEKKQNMEAPSESFLTKLRSECQCITNPPLLTIPYTQWIYGVLHAIMGPTIKVLDILEDDALQQDLKDLKIDLKSSKENRKVNKDLSNEIQNIKSYIDELTKAIKTSKSVLPKWKQIRQNPVEGQPICGSKFCLQNLMGTDPLFSV